MGRHRNTLAAEADEAQVVVLVGTGTGRRLRIGPGITLGRGDVDLFLDGDGISRKHAEITQLRDRSYAIRDLGSRNGTFLNGLKVQTGRLEVGDRIALGSSTVLVFTACDPMEEQLVQAQKLQMLGELAGGIAHDFNNLLAALLSSAGYLQAMLEDPTPDIAACVGDIDFAARRARDLTGQLLAFSHHEQSERIPVALSEIVDDAMRVARRLVGGGVEIEVQTATDARVCCDRAQLLQVIMNLCVNGSDAMPRGGKLDIRVALAKDTDPDLACVPAGNQSRYAALSIADNGIGMAPQTLARIFEPFFTTKAPGKGTGLGLATAQRIAREHGGSLTARSTLGVGTEFRLLLPTTTEAAASNSRARLTDLDLPLSGKILLVEDERVVRSAARRVLVQAGLDVVTADNGLVAIERFREQVPDLVLLDLDLPHLSGEEVIEVIRELDDVVDVLVCSGSIDSDRRPQLERCGVSGFLPKPYSSLELVARVAEVLAARRRS